LKERGEPYDDTTRIVRVASILQGIKSDLADVRIQSSRTIHGLLKARFDQEPLLAPINIKPYKRSIESKDSDWEEKMTFHTGKHPGFDVVLENKYRDEHSDIILISYK